MVAAKCMTKDACVVVVQAAPLACVGMHAFSSSFCEKHPRHLRKLVHEDSDPSEEKGFEFLLSQQVGSTQTRILSPRSRGDPYLNVCAGNSDGNLGRGHLQVLEAKRSGARNSAGKSARRASRHHSAVKTGDGCKRKSVCQVGQCHQHDTFCGSTHC